MTPQSAKIPVHAESDREVLGHALTSLALADPLEARVAWIADTLSLSEFRVSESLWGEISANSGLEVAGHAEELRFDVDGNLR